MFPIMNRPTLKIDWMRGFGNSPRIILEGIKLPEYPDSNNPIWERTAKGLHLARIGDFAFYFYTNGKPTEGFAGRTFAGTLKDGTKFTYRGAWSSRAGCINDAISRRELTGNYIIDIACDYRTIGMDKESLDRTIINSGLIEKGIYMSRSRDSEITFEPCYKGNFKGDEEFVYPPEE